MLRGHRIGTPNYLRDFQMNLVRLAAELENVYKIRVDGDVLREVLTDSGIVKSKVFCVTIAELADIDARLPAAIEGQLAAAQDITKGAAPDIFFGSLLRDTLLFWEEVNLINTLCSGVIPYRRLVSFEDVCLNEAVPRVSLYLYGGEVSNFTSSQNITIKLVKRTGGYIYMICPEWLEQNYPGWKNRYYAGEALGCSGVDLLEYVLPKDMPTYSVAPDMAQVKF